MQEMAGQLTNFQFVFMMCAGVAAILGVTALVVNAFRSGRRGDCMGKFIELNQRMTDYDHERVTDTKLSNQRFEYIEGVLREIKDWQRSIDNKMDRIFEVLNSIPKRKINGRED